jgi:hypothetical protein
MIQLHDSGATAPNPAQVAAAINRLSGGCTAHRRMFLQCAEDHAAHEEKRPARKLSDAGIEQMLANGEVPSDTLKVFENSRLGMIYDLGYSSLEDMAANMPLESETLH